MKNWLVATVLVVLVAGSLGVGYLTGFTKSVTKTVLAPGPYFDLVFRQISLCPNLGYIAPWSVVLSNGESITAPVPNGTSPICCSASPANPSTIVFSVTSGTYVFPVTPHNMLTPPNGTVTVSNQDVTVTLGQEIASCGSTTTSGGGNASQVYQLEFAQESNCPYGSWLIPWAVMLNNHTVVVQPSNGTLPLSYTGSRLTSDGNYSAIWFSVPNGTYDYTILPKDFEGVEQNGTLTVNGGNIVVQVSAFITAMGCTTSSTSKG